MHKNSEKLLSVCLRHCIETALFVFPIFQLVAAIHGSDSGRPNDDSASEATSGTVVLSPRSVDLKLRRSEGEWNHLSLVLSLREAETQRLESKIVELSPVGEDEDSQTAFSNALRVKSIRHIQSKLITERDDLLSEMGQLRAEMAKLRGEAEEPSAEEGEQDGEDAFL